MPAQQTDADDTEAARLRRIIAELEPGLDVDAELRHVVAGDDDGEWHYRRAPAATDAGDAGDDGDDGGDDGDDDDGDDDGGGEKQPAKKAAKQPAKKAAPERRGSPSGQPAALNPDAARGRRSSPKGLDSSDDDEFSAAFDSWISDSAGEQIDW